MEKSITPKLSISVCILTKNDEAFLDDCIKSLPQNLREIIILDLGSTDNTVNIARQYTKRIYTSKWHNDYAEARNFFLDYVSSDWVLYMDAFERIAPESLKEFNQALLNKKNIAQMFKVIEMFQEKELETFSCRMFRRRNDIRFKRVMRESVTEDIQSIGKKEKLGISYPQIVINRYNYLKYIDETELYQEKIELAKNGLEIDSSDEIVETFYKLELGLSLNALGEHEEAEKEIRTVLNNIKKLEKQTVYNIPIFIQPYLFFAFKLSKAEKYAEGLKIMEEGLNIYNNSLTMLIRYCEFLYANKMYKECLDHLAKIKFLKNEDKHYQLESIDYAMINKISTKLENLAYGKYMQSQGMPKI